MHSQMKMSGSDALRERSLLRNTLLGSASHKSFSPGEFYLKWKIYWFSGSRIVYPRCSPHQAVATTGVHPNGMVEGPFILKQTSKTFVQTVTANNYQRCLYHRERKSWWWLILSLYATQVGVQAKVMTIITFCFRIILFCGLCLFSGYEHDFFSQTLTKTIGIEETRISSTLDCG